MAIVKMKKLRAFAMRSDKDSLLHELQLLGCVEITEPAEITQNPIWAGLAEREKSNLNECKSLYTRLSNAILLLDKYAYVKTGMFKNRETINLSELFDPGLDVRALDYVSKIEDAENRLMKLYSDETKKQSAIASLKLWKPLDIPLESSDTQFTAVRFGTVPIGQNEDALKEEILNVTNQAELFFAGKDREQAGVLIIFHKDYLAEINQILRKLNFSRIIFKEYTGTAKENIEEIEIETAEIKTKIKNTLAELEKLGEGRDTIKLYYDRVGQDISAEEAKESLLDTQSAFGLEAWVALQDVKALEPVMKKYGCAYELSDPTPEDTVPIKLKSNPLTSPLNMVTEMYSLPSYDGIDPNPLIMPFFTVFFGIMYNDAGYGLVLIAFSLFIRAKVKLRGALKYMMSLMTLCGITSVVVGLLTGSFFGDAIPTIAGIYGREITLPYVFSPLEDPLLVLIGALIIGGIQIITGMIISAYMKIRDGHPLDALMDEGSWWLLFAGIAVLATGGTYWVAIAGVVALVLTQGRSKPKLIGKLISGLASLYDITGYFGDILSYSRLMALMLAGGVIATVVNMLGSLPGSIVFYLIIFLVGHLFNMGINIIGTYVHASRLQYLEYFGKFYREGGKPFRPLTLKTKYVDIIKEEN
ncbi:MAG: V-type ATP synthase subunit I [Clostridiales bacterium]|nr:V-type ATP synthase subunit I [Clostridiales bacterium]